MEVNNLKERIKEIRKSNKMNQSEFGAKIGVKGNTIGNYELGLRNPSDAVIFSICREFNINEEWLRTGEGEMSKKRTRKQEIGEFVNDVMELSDDDFKKRFVRALSKLNEKDWEVLAKIVDEIEKES